MNKIICSTFIFIGINVIAQPVILLNDSGGLRESMSTIHLIPTGEDYSEEIIGFSHDHIYSFTPVLNATGDSIHYNEDYFEKSLNFYVIQRFMEAHNFTLIQLKDVDADGRIDLVMSAERLAGIY
jgi:hypothetical protein